MRKQKQNEMKKNPETLTLDYGDCYKVMYDEHLNDNVLNGCTDAQFYTGRPEQWKKTLKYFFNKQCERGVWNGKPEFGCNSTGWFVKVYESKEDCISLVSVTVYETGIIMLQGKNFKDWCKNHFCTVKNIVKNCDNTNGVS